MKRAVLIAVLLALGLFAALGVRIYIGEHSRETPASARDERYARDNLMTNTALHSIDLAEVLDGGPGKDGIPALTNPAFTDAAHADAAVQKSDGILVRAGGVVKFYPYNILVWHEVVNDTVGGVPLVITFCPLCGSAIVFDARVAGKPETFGVSGKLYNSNLLMYDKTSESLWSQIEGEAVVGDRTGTKLAVYPSQVVSFAELAEKYPGAQVQSSETGYARDYSFYPYGDYNSSQTILFPVAVTDTRLPAKEIMYVVNYGGHSVALAVRDVTKAKRATIAVGKETLAARVENGEIIVTAPDGSVIPGYTAMWFAWAVYHQKDGIVWTAP